MKLIRAYANVDGKISFPPNSYGQEKGIWYIRPPGCHLGSLAQHNVIEHEDGTITVSPSILQHDYVVDADGIRNVDVHGFLERGVWREA